MRVPPVPAGALALLDDLLHRGERRVQVGDRDQLRPADQLRGGLGPRRADEHRPLAHRSTRPRSPSAMPRYRWPDGGELLAARQQLVGGTGSRGGAVGTNPPRPAAPSPRDARGTGSAAAPARRTAAGPAAPRTGSIRSAAGSWAGQGRGGADGRHQVGDQRQVQHLLDGDAVQRPCASGPPPRPARAVSPSSVPSLRLNSANRYWHMIMCSSCGGLGEQPPQVLPVRHHDPGFGHAAIVGALITYLQPDSTKSSDGREAHPLPFPLVGPRPMIAPTSRSRWTGWSSSRSALSRAAVMARARSGTRQRGTR